MQYLRNKYSLILLIAVLIFSGCKKVIDVQLNNAAAQIVITGEVNNLPGPYTVTISKTVDYTANNIFPSVAGAFVSIAGNGIVDTLTETSTGTYTTHSLKGQPGSSYSLYVAVEGKVYTAASVMPYQVPLDSIGFSTGRNSKTINAVAYFQDPPGIADYYEFIEYNHGKQFNNNRGWSVFDDRLSDGRYISNTLYDDSTDIKHGDTLSVKMKCTDQGVYNYLFTLSQITSSRGFSAPSPANPISNLSNNSLGYFSANTLQIKNVIVR
jgi:Domain of unknown function (DUF4249)